MKVAVFYFTHFDCEAVGSLNLIFIGRNIHILFNIVVFFYYLPADISDEYIIH